MAVPKINTMVIQRQTTAKKVTHLTQTLSKSSQNKPEIPRIRRRGGRDGGREEERGPQFDQVHQNMSRRKNSLHLSVGFQVARTSKMKQRTTKNYGGPQKQSLNLK